MQILIFIFSFLNLLILIFNIGKKTSVFSCGLGAYNGSIPPNPLALKWIGKDNETRGKHSSGIAVDNRIRKGVLTNALFSNMIKDYDFPKKYKNTFNVIIHTRQATSGAHTLANAHPFGFGNNPNKEDILPVADTEFIGAHNGSLDNWQTLIKDIDTKGNELNIDSKALLYRIYHDKNFKVLSEYEGAAALIFYFTGEPKKLYAFKGAAGDVEERPLYYTQVENTKGKITGVYLSSLKSSLEFIFVNSEIKEVPNNTLLVFENGEITQELKIVRTADKKEFKYSRNVNYRHYDYHDDYYANNYPKVDYFSKSKTNSKIKEFDPIINIPEFISFRHDNKLTFSKERILISELLKSSIYFLNFRFFRNGHLLSGLFIVDEKGVVISWFQNKKTADDFLEKHKDKNYILLAFVSGILAKDIENYEKLLKFQQEENSNTKLPAHDIYNFASIKTASIYSMFPICSIKRTYRSGEPSYTIDGLFYYNGESSFDVVISHPFSLFEYGFSTGFLKDVFPITQSNSYVNNILENAKALDKKHWIHKPLKEFFSFSSSNIKNISKEINKSWIATLPEKALSTIEKEIDDGDNFEDLNGVLILQEYFSLLEILISSVNDNLDLLKNVYGIGTKLNNKLIDATIFLANHLEDYHELKSIQLTEEQLETIQICKNLKKNSIIKL